MATTAMEARDNVCLLALVTSHGVSQDMCRPEECSAWSWEDGCDASGSRIGYCTLAGEAARSHSAKLKSRRNTI